VSLQNLGYSIAFWWGFVPAQAPNDAGKETKRNEACDDSKGNCQFLLPLLNLETFWI